MSYRGERYENDRPNVLGWILVTIGIFMALVVLGWALNWFAAPFEATSPGRVQDFYRVSNDAYSALESSLASVTQMDNRIVEFEEQYGEDQSVWPQGKNVEFQQLKQQRMNLVNAYNTQCGQYEAMWNDEWRAIASDSDLPKTCDTIQ